MKKITLYILLCAITSFSMISCKSKAQRDAENEKKKAEIAAGAAKEAEEQNKRELKAEEQKHLDQANIAYSSNLNFYKGVSGTYQGTFSTTYTDKESTFTENYTIMISLSPVIPQDNNAARDRTSEILAQIEGMSFDAEIVEIRENSKRVAKTCSPRQLKPDFKKGQIRISCPPEGEHKLPRNYTITLDHIKHNENNAKEAPARSESVADSLLKHRLSQVMMINAEISNPDGLKLMVTLDRSESLTEK